jgi:hypothetical protein
MINFSISKNTIRTVKPGDADWLIKNGFTCSPRAGVEISEDCPYEYKMVIAKCWTNGWIKPVANVLEKDMMWEELIK